MNSPIFHTLAETPLLAGLDRAALALLESEGKIHAYGAGQLIVREGESGHSFFILMTGEVEVIKHADSPHAVLLARLHPGTFFGEMCVVDPVPRAASVKTLTPVTVVEITAATFHHLYQKLPAQYAILLLNLARDLARRLRVIDEGLRRPGLVNKEETSFVLPG